MRQCCSVSKARRPLPAASANAGASLAGAELRSLKLSQLISRALATASLSEDQIQQAQDAEEPRAALVNLLLKAQDAGTRGAEQHLRDELRSLRLTALSRRAGAAGLSDAEIADAIDSDDPKGSLTELLVQAELFGDRAERSAALRKELGSLKRSELQKRARTAGADQGRLEEAEDCEDHNEACSLIIDLICEQAAWDADADALAGVSDTDRPHLGASGARSAGTSAKPKLAQRPIQSTTKHVMLSYQWDHQATVTRVYDVLTKLGVNCWMDVKGGMGSDIYDAMAYAVANASVVVCFMSVKYQESANCMLEAKFAQQSGIGIIPIIMESGGWRPSGWLGLITAGSLWIRLSDESRLDDNIRQLYDQIQIVVGDAPDDIDEPSEDAGVASATEVKEELERLREDLDAKADTKVAVALLADPSQSATIPAGVPALPAKFQITEQIQELTRLVLSTSASDLHMPRVGFYGMGGIGKTVTGAAIVRNADVRRYFHAIIWLPLGQSPVIAKLQNLCHMQCTGMEMSPELSNLEQKQALQQAMKGKRLLLVLDDLWEMDHEQELNFADADVGSKVLISTRIKALLDGAHQVEVGLPSLSDSARMLLVAAGAEDSSCRPAGVSEIVDMCGQLPLALGIAGRLAASLDMVGTDDWSGMIGVLKEELRQSHSGGVEEVMIRASLRGLKGSESEQSNVKSLLLLFALVPEDTFCPLEVLLMMFNAVHTDAGATLMHIRKWLKILINRSLVLSTVDRPSVHDLGALTCQKPLLLLSDSNTCTNVLLLIVLDFAVAQYSDAELWDAHRRIVESFRANRPSDSHGRKQHDVSRSSSPLSSYVGAECVHHVRMAMKQDKLCVVKWLQDVPQDSLTLTAARCCGTKELSLMAWRAQDERDWWLAARYWSLVRQLVFEGGSSGPAQEPAFKSLHAISQMSGASDPEARDDLRFRNAQVIITAFDLPTVTSRMAELEEILQLKAATREPAVTAGLRQFFNAVIPKMHDWVGDSKVIADNQCELFLMLRNAMSEDPDPAEQKRCRIMLMASHQTMDMGMLSESFSWDTFFGVDGNDLRQTIREYSYSAHHAFLVSAVNCDGLISYPPAAPLLFHWGDMVAVEEFYDRQLSHNRLCIRSMQTENGGAANEHAGIMTGLPAWAFHLHTTGIMHGRETLRALQIEAGLTYSTAQATVDSCLVPWVRKRGDTTMNVYFTASEYLTWLAQMGHILMATKGPGASREEVLENLPSVEDLASMALTQDELSNMEGLVGCYLSAFGAVASVCEKYEDCERALVYIDYVLSADLAQAGTQQPICRVQHSMLKGRVLAALGRVVEAAEILDSAAAQAHQYGIHIYEVLSLRDLKLLVLDGFGHGELGSRRLGAALRLLKCPEKLTALLNGLNASDLVALPPPDGRHSLSYKHLIKDPMLDALRKELVCMRLKGLCDRAKCLGVDDDALEAAFDEDDCKAAVIALILDASEARREAEEQLNKDTSMLRTELEGLRLKALRKRARDAGIGGEALEDAFDSDDPKGTLVDLLIDTVATSKPVVFNVVARDDASLVKELEQLRLTEIRKRARDAGVDGDELEHAMDNDDPKLATIQLLLAQQTASKAIDSSSASAICMQDELKLEL